MQQHNYYKGIKSGVRLFDIKKDEYFTGDFANTLYAIDKGFSDENFLKELVKRLKTPGFERHLQALVSRKIITQEEANTPLAPLPETKMIILSEKGRRAVDHTEKFRKRASDRMHRLNERRRKSNDCKQSSKSLD